jgi:hypothetical protein
MLKTTKFFALIIIFLFTLKVFTSDSKISSSNIAVYDQLFPEKTVVTTTGEQSFSPAIPRFGTPSPEPEFPLEQRVTPVSMPAEIRGVYVTGWGAGSSSLFQRLLHFTEETGINSLVIDIKDDTGFLSYQSRIPKVNTLQSWKLKIPNPYRLLQTLKQRNIYPIARLVVFKDPFLAETRPDLALKQKNGDIWRDYKGLAWVDPHSKEVWEYNIEIAKEAICLGFPEIQFDYVRFASDGDLSNCVYPHSEGKSKEDVIKEFLLYAREELEPLGAVISADVFGLACSAADDLRIGQKLEKIAEAVPVISPMVYPSHYAKGSYGLGNPDLFPYETVLQSMKDASRRLDGYPVKLRPWLQDFSLGSKYGKKQIEAQIQAVYDAGVRDWIFWNPSCRYEIEKYLTKSYRSSETLVSRPELAEEEGFATPSQVNDPSEKMDTNSQSPQREEALIESGR